MFRKMRDFVSNFVGSKIPKHSLGAEDYANLSHESPLRNKGAMMDRGHFVALTTRQSMD